ncbi:hypothetical protein C8R45DRAFT_969962 [Mycena sanguinolenta]|nr:hypothetical protein C8R45DRAFT_969962 [Mycena sanguinolenta]
MPPARPTMSVPASSALAARMAESLMRSGSGTVSNLEKRDAHEQEREAFYKRVCLAHAAADADHRNWVEYLLLEQEYTRRFGVELLDSRDANSTAEQRSACPSGLVSGATENHGCADDCERATGSGAHTQSVQSSCMLGQSTRRRRSFQRGRWAGIPGLGFVC